MLSEKLEWITLRKKLTNITDLNPLTLNMEQIFNLPKDIQVTDEGTISIQNSSNSSSSTASSQSIDPEKEMEKKKKEIQDLLYSSESKLSQKKKAKMDTFIEELFTDSLEIESWVSAKETIPVYSGPSMI